MSIDNLKHQLSAYIEETEFWSNYGYYLRELALEHKANGRFDEADLCFGNSLIAFGRADSYQDTVDWYARLICSES